MVPDVTGDHTQTPSPDQFSDDQFEQAEAALADARARLAEIPAEVVVVNHAMGFYELAAINLSAAPPRLHEAALAIDALGCLIEGLGPRLGDDYAVLAEALANIRLAFVQIKGAQAE
jgi:hypothetical protein